MMPGNQPPMGYPGMQQQQQAAMMQQQNFMQQQQQPQGYPMMQGGGNNMMQGGNQMMPGGNQMMQGGTPMMQGGNQMMMQGGGGNPMQQQQGMMGGGMYYPGQQMNQMVGVNPYYYPMPGGGGSPGNIQGMTPQMAKEFKEKQGKLAEAAARQQQKAMEQQQRKQQRLMEQQRKLMEEQRKKMEQEMKHRQFQEQQKKLKEFSTIGGRKNFNADTLIDSIIGKSAAPQRMVSTHTASAPASSPAPTYAPTQPQVSTQAQGGADDFGDFLEGPSSGSSSSQPASQPTRSTPTPPAPAVKQQPPKKDLMSMMYECSDLSAPKEAKSFHQRTSVKDVVPTVPSTAQTYQPSRTARQWGGHEDDKLSELFTLPTPQPPPQPQQPPQQPPQTAPTPPPPTQVGPGTPPASPGVYAGLAKLPPWASGKAPVPQMYTQVLEASLRDKKISTDALYSILVGGSGLPRELLGHLWSLCNRRTPGQLCTDELYLLLAMVAAAQNNLNVATLEVLNNCPQAPLPWLSQMQQQQQQQHEQQQPQQQQQQPAESIPAPHPPATTQEEDDFADFQTATHSSPAAPTPASASITSFPSSTISSSSSSSAGASQVTPFVTSSTAGVTAITVPDSFRNLPHPPGSTPSLNTVVSLQDTQEDKYAVFRSGLGVSETTAATSEDDFSDFKGPPSPTQSPAQPQPQEENTKTSSGFADFSGFRDSLPSDAQSTGTQGFADFSSAPKTGSDWSNTNTETAPNWSNPATETTDDFADFQTSSSGEKTDKFAAIKALVMDKSKFSTVPVLKDNEADLGAVASEESVREDDWGQISPSEDTSQSHSSSESTNKFDSFIPSSDVDATSSSSDLFSSSHTTNDNDIKDDDDWANFEAGPTTGTSQIEWGKSHPELANKPKDTNKPTTKPDSLKVDPKKAYGIFSRNNADTSRTNFLDTEPPDFPPEMPDNDDEDDDGFDKFGTFQSTGLGSTASGVSSLVTPYGGLEDFGGFSTSQGALQVGTNSSNNMQKSGTAKEKESTPPPPAPLPSIDYNEWKNNTLDSQSMKSFDFKNTKEGSPSGMDSQSVSSLELAASDSRKSTTPQDARSVASLELKASTMQDANTPTADENSGDKNDEEESFGQFSSASTLTPGSKTSLQHSKSDSTLSSPPPMDIKEMLTKGEFTNLGDRYSGLTKEPQDSERHAYDWKRCLSKCQEMICQANNTFNSITSQEVLEEVLESNRGQEYIKGIVEIYRIVCRIRTSMKAVSISNAQLEECVAEAGLAWGNLAVFIADTPLMPESSVLDFSRCVLPGDGGGGGNGSSAAACGVCLLSVDARSRAHDSNSSKVAAAAAHDAHKLTYGGKQYHAACANFWVNCVDSTLPALRIPELL